MKIKEKHAALPEEELFLGEPSSLHVESICTPHKPRFPTNLQQDIFVSV